jgi:hypothetical protein
MACSRGCCSTQGEHYRSIVIGGAPSYGTTYEKQLDKDRPAYKRMRDDGLQPKGLSGAADLERRASSRWEIEAGRILPESQSKRIDAAQAEAVHLMGA